MVRICNVNLVKNELKKVLLPEIGKKKNDEDGNCQPEFPSEDKRKKTLMRVLNLIDDLVDANDGAYAEGRADGMETMARILTGGDE